MTRWLAGDRVIVDGPRPRVMGILNVTPDSFSDGGQFFTPQAAVRQAQRLLDEGADLLDLGAESTRPNAAAITPEEEHRRLLPVLDGLLLLRPRAIVSVDTYHAATAKAAVQHGAEIVNDVSGLLWDGRMASVLADQEPGVVLMHTRGRPTEWTSLPALSPEEVLPLVSGGLTSSLALASRAGIPPSRIVVDPGFGFGKIGAENFTLLAQLAELRNLGFPILSGTSRKRFLTMHVPEATLEQRREATSASNVAAILGGAHILRVHDVRETRLAADVADRLLRHQS